MEVAAVQPKKSPFKKFSFRGIDLDALLDMSTDDACELCYFTEHLDGYLFNFLDNWNNTRGFIGMDHHVKIGMEVVSCVIIGTLFWGTCLLFSYNRVTLHNILRKMAAINQKELSSGTLVCDQMAEPDEEFTPSEDAHFLSTGQKNIAVYK